MSIKQNGGVFGRNPTFNDVTIEGQLTFDGDIDINSDLKVDGDLDVTGSGSFASLDVFSAGIKTNSNAAVGFQLGGDSSGSGAIGNIINNAGRFAIEPASTRSFAIRTGATKADSLVVDHNNHVKISTGNLVIGTSGKGIDFSATSGTGTSELLSDYEEGSWTSLVGGTATYGANSGRYTKIGRQVMATFDLNITLIGTGSTSTITGLPFATGDSIAEGVSVNFFDGLASSVVELNAYVINSEIRFRSLTAAGTGLSDVAVLGDSCRVTGTAIYTV